MSSQSDSERMINAEHDRIDVVAHPVLQSRYIIVSPSVPISPLCLLLQQPLHALDGVTHKLLTRLQLREDTPIPMREPTISIYLRPNPLLLPQNPLIYQRLVSQRVRTTDLEVRWRQALVTALPQHRAEQLTCAILVGMLHVVAEEEIAGFDAKDSGIAVLLPGVIVLFVLLRNGRTGAYGWDHEMLASDRWGELLVAGEVGDGGRDVAACAGAADEEAFAWVASEGRGIFCGLDHAVSQCI